MEQLNCKISKRHWIVFSQSLKVVSPRKRTKTNGKLLNCSLEKVVLSAHVNEKLKHSKWE